MQPDTQYKQARANKNNEKKIEEKMTFLCN